MVKISLALRDLIDYQVSINKENTYPIKDYEKEINKKISYLNKKYDIFFSNYGHINKKENKKIFEKDISLPLLSSIEKLDEETKEYKKAEVFYRPTIKVKKEREVNNAEDGLKVILNEKGKVDIKYISELCKISKEEVIKELGNKIFKDPDILDEEDKYKEYVTADEYLGHVKDKLLFSKRKSLYI